MSKSGYFSLKGQPSFTNIMHTSVSVGVAVLPQGDLDVLDLLGDGRQHSLFQTVELVEAAPGSYLAQTHEDTAHGLKKKTKNDH